MVHYVQQILTLSTKNKTAKILFPLQSTSQETFLVIKTFIFTSHILSTFKVYQNLTVTTIAKFLM